MGAGVVMSEQCKIEGDQIVIRLDIAALETAALGSDYVRDIDDFKVTKPTDFAKEVVLALSNEEEDGTTLVHRMFDKAFEYVLENGGEGFWIPDLGEYPGNEATS